MSESSGSREESQTFESGSLDDDKMLFRSQGSSAPGQPPEQAPKSRFSKDAGVKEQPSGTTVALLHELNRVWET